MKKIMLCSVIFLSLQSVGFSDCSDDVYFTRYDTASEAEEACDEVMGRVSYDYFYKKYVCICEDYE